MTTIRMYRRGVIAAGVLALAMTASAGEQDARLLNTIEVRQLAARGEPADHARLAAHFAALADRYEAEAKRHASMAQGFVGNPNRSLGTDVSAHCKRLAALNAQSAAIVRELAAYHEKLAAGEAAAPPREAARFEAGAGARPPTRQELDALAARASTPSDHRVLQEYFLTLAAQYKADAEAHTTLAQSYRGTRLAQAAVHHERLASLARESAKEATEAAARHAQLAGAAR